jgi:predicted phosphodiesterase
MTRILFAGDIHADRSHLEYLFRVAKRFDVDVLFALGDFGYWPRNAGGQRFLKGAVKLTEDSGIPLYWIDGNHEDHWALGNLTRGVRGAFIPTKVPYYDHHDNSNLLYVPRGHSWTWDGVSFMAMGGAYSVDKPSRTMGQDWFPEESLSDDDVAYGKAVGKVDVMVTHDVSSVAPILEKLLLMKGRSYKLIPEADANRRALEEIRLAVRPDVMVHGHYHVDYKEIVDGTIFRGLDCNLSGDGFSWTIMDTRDFKDV